MPVALFQGVVQVKFSSLRGENSSPQISLSDRSAYKVSPQALLKSWGFSQYFHQACVTQLSNFYLFWLLLLRL